jgi:hypothetical protein
MSFFKRARKPESEPSPAVPKGRATGKPVVPSGPSLDAITAVYNSLKSALQYLAAGVCFRVLCALCECCAGVSAPEDDAITLGSHLSFAIAVAEENRVHSSFVAHTVNNRWYHGDGRAFGH